MSTSKSYLPKNYVLKDRNNIGMYERMARYIREHPSNSYSKCINDLNIKANQWTFYRLRSALAKEGVNIPISSLAGVPKTSKKHGIYMKIFTHPAKDVPQVAKDLLKAFIDCLNNTKRTRMEIVEYAHPSELEVREIR